MGYVRPRSWTPTIVLGIAFGIAFKLFMKAIVPLLGAEPINETFQHVVGNGRALLAVLWSGIVVAAFGEETVMRGFLFERLGKLIGTGLTAKAVIVLVTAAAFGLAHRTLQGSAEYSKARSSGSFTARYSRRPDGSGSHGRPRGIQRHRGGDHLLEAPNGGESARIWLGREGRGSGPAALDTFRCPQYI
jgi:Type II CAAX prenyl endopeptidase Rce1-like